MLVVEKEVVGVVVAAAEVAANVVVAVAVVAVAERVSVLVVEGLETFQVLSVDTAVVEAFAEDALELSVLVVVAAAVAFASLVEGASEAFVADAVAAVIEEVVYQVAVAAQ